jgi:hypothetical protein
LKENWTRARPEEEVKKVVIPGGEETYILCRTSGRREKEKAIRERFCSRMEEALKHLEKSIATGRLKDRNRMERWLGKIQARHPSVNDLYEISLRETGETCSGRCERVVGAGTSRAKAPTCCAPAGGNARGVMVEIYAVDPGRSVISGIEERTFDSASLSSEGAARQSPRDGT